jgi:hypothetical protein
MIWQYNWWAWLYHLDWNSNDSSWNWNNWTPLNVSWVWGKVWSWSASFNWSNTSYINLWNPSALNIIWNISITAYFKINAEPALSAIYTIVEKWYDWTSEQYTIIYTQSTPWVYTIRVATYNNSWWEKSAIYNIRLTIWVFYRVKWIFNWSAWKLFLNWVEVASTTTTQWPYSSTWNVYIWISNIAWSLDRFINWVIDEVIIENRSWLASDEKRQYTASKWRFIL